MQRNDNLRDEDVHVGRRTQQADVPKEEVGGEGERTQQASVHTGKVGDERRWVETIRYRIGQGVEQLGWAAALKAEDYEEVERWLSREALALFETMSRADQQHSLRVCRGLLALGYEERDLLAAALLHDVGKAQGCVPFWTRPVIVLGKALAPGWLRRRIVSPADLVTGHVPYWRRGLSYAWWHADVGADLAAQAGLSERAVLYIRTHHQPDGPAEALHRVDEVS